MFLACLLEGRPGYAILKGTLRLLRGNAMIDFNKDKPERGDIVEGRNAVTEALKAGRTLDKLFIAKGQIDGSLRPIVAMAKESGAVISEVDRRKLDALSVTGAHQGVLAYFAEREYSTLDQVFAFAEESGRPPLIIVCDEINDPHNLGAIIRTANASGAHGVIIPKRRSAGLSATVAKAASGALEYTPVVRVSNIAATLDELKERGVWIFGADAEGEKSLYEEDLTGPVAIVVGSEGLGIGRLVRERCDFLLKIPMLGQINSLNASVAAAILMYETVRQRTARTNARGAD